jgi:HK97 family phage portal protein
MGFWSRLLGRSEAKSSSINVFREVFGYPAVKSGQTVNWATALECTTALACCRTISEDLAALPAHLRRARDAGGSDVVRDHPVARFIDRGPNDWQTWLEFVETLTFNAVLGGGGYALKTRSPIDGRVVELLPLPAVWVTPKRRSDWSVYYEVMLAPGSDMGGQRIIYEARDILHIRGASVDSYRAIEGIRVAREAIGLALATEDAHARLHANGLSPSGVYSVDGPLNEAQHKNLRTYLEQANSRENRSRALILDRGAKWMSQAMSGVDAQHLETRRFQIEEVCRAFRVLPIMVGHADKTATYASAEQMFLAHVVHTLLPWVRRWESRLARELLTEQEQAEGLYFDISVHGLLRGDARSRGEYYQRAVLSGWMTRNEVRMLEEMNPKPGLDDPLTPSNTTVTGARPDAAADEPEE